MQHFDFIITKLVDVRAIHLDQLPSPVTFQLSRLIDGGKATVMAPVSKHKVRSDTVLAAEYLFRTTLVEEEKNDRRMCNPHRLFFLPRLYPLPGKGEPCSSRAVPR
jgi:hypothetical protein